MTDTRKGYPVVNQELSGNLTGDEQADLTSTRVSKTFAGGLLEVSSIQYADLGSADGTYIFVCFNAVSDTDADTRLGTAGSRIRINLGERRGPWLFDPDSPCTRIDMKSDTASETGDSMVYIEGVALL